MNASTTLCNALEILDRYHASVEHITLGLDSFALVVSSAALENTLYDVIADIQKTCRPDDVRDLLRRLRREVQAKRLDPADGRHLIQ